MHRLIPSLLAAAVSLGALLFHASAAELSVEVLKERQKAMRRAVEIAQPATVGIVFPQSSEAGSGVIVSEEGLILTAAHVSGRSGRDVTVILPSGERLPGKTLGAYRSLDAGMIQIQAEKRQFPSVALGDSSALETGQWCLALGHPGGFLKERPAPVRLGRVLDENVNGFILTDSTLVAGDSGGPLLDIEGRLLGIHSSIGYDLAENRHVPIHVFREHWDLMLSGQMQGRLFDWLRRDVPYLGVIVEPSRPDEPGALVRQVVPGSPADEAGLQPDDRILRVDGRELTQGSQLAQIIRGRQSGDTLVLNVSTPGSGVRDLRVSLKSRHDRQDALEDRAQEGPDEPGFLGVRLEREGRFVVIKDLLPGSPGERAGLRRGDTIIQYDALPMNALEEFVLYVEHLSSGDKLTLVVEREGELHLRAITLGSRPK